MTSRWEEIAHAMRASIESGELRAGDRLPAEAELAAQWRVARMTVHRALSDPQRPLPAGLTLPHPQEIDHAQTQPRLHAD